MKIGIVDLWLNDAAPDVDGLYRADGRAWSFEVDGPDLSWFDVGLSLDLDEVLPPSLDDARDIDEFVRAELPGGLGFVCCGEGSMGADGWFARLDSGGGLIWLVTMNSSNPFVAIKVDGTSVAFTNNLGNSLAVDVASAEFA